MLQWAMIAVGIASTSYADMARSEGKPTYVVASSALDDCLIAAAERLRVARLPVVDRYVEFFASCQEERKAALSLCLKMADSSGQFSNARERFTRIDGINDRLNQRYLIWAARALARSIHQGRRGQFRSGKRGRLVSI